MQVPFLDLKAQYQCIKNEIHSAIENVLESQTFILGKPVSDFETEFAKLHNVKHCIGLSSGTDGNHSVLWALGIGKGDEVIIPVNTFIATAWGAVLNGAKPVFVDCDPDSYNLSVSRLEDAITSNTKAVVAVHLYGQPADLDPLKAIAKKHNIIFVEDCAQAHIAEYKGQKVGGLSDAASFSFYPGKNLGAYGEGGAAVTNDDELARTIRMIREHGSMRKYEHEMYGQNYRMEAMQGSILMVKIKYLKNWTAARRKAASRYNELLQNIEEIKLPMEMSYAKHVYHLFVIQLRKGTATLRDELAEFLRQNGISTGLHYPIPLHLQTCFKHLGYKKGDFPVAEQLAECGLSLPMFPELTELQQEYIQSKIKEFFASKKVNVVADLNDVDVRI